MSRGLLLTPAQAARLPARREDPRFACAWRSTFATADRVAALGAIAFPEDTYGYWYVFRNRMIDLCVAYLATGDARYIVAVSAVVADLAGRDRDFWQGPHYPNRPRTRVWRGAEYTVGELETAQLAMGVALAYDTLGDALPEATRQAMRSMLRDMAHPLLRASVMIQADTWVMNHLCVNAAGWLLCLLALDGDRADIDLARRALGLWIGNIESDGSYGEGFHYYAYPVNCLFFALTALRNALGERLPQAHRLSNSFDWTVYCQADIEPSAAYGGEVATAINFHDCPRYFQLEAPEALLFANLCGHPVAQWYLDTYLLSGLSRPGPCLHTTWHQCDALLPALYEPGLPALSPAEAGFATARCFFDSGYAYLRSGWATRGERLVLALQSGGGTRSRAHEHFDRNAFVLYADGEYFIADPGHSCYRGPLHEGYDIDTASHSTWTVDGRRQSLAYVERGMIADEAHTYPSCHNMAELRQQLHPQIQFVASQARRCYDPPLVDYTRSVWMVGGRYVVIRDTLDKRGQPGALRGAFLLNNRDSLLEIEDNGLSYLFKRPRASLSMHIFGTTGGLACAWEDAIVHDAYHILPGQAVEGKPGDGRRLVLTPEGDQASLVYVLCPLRTGEAPPMIAYDEKSAALRIEIDGHRDEFTFAPDAVHYLRQGGADYLF